MGGPGGEGGKPFWRKGFPPSPRMRAAACNFINTTSSKKHYPSGYTAVPARQLRLGGFRYAAPDACGSAAVLRQC